MTEEADGGTPTLSPSKGGPGSVAKPASLSPFSALFACCDFKVMLRSTFASFINSIGHRAGFSCVVGSKGVRVMGSPLLLEANAVKWLDVQLWHEF